MLLPQLIRDLAAERPDATALVCGERRMSYAELDARSSAVACALRDAGQGPGSRIAHLDHNAPEAIELLFGAAKIGAVLVPLNWRLAAPELAAVLADAKVKTLVCGPSFAQVGRSLNAQARVVGEDYEPWVQAAAGEDLGHVGEDEDVVLQLYTSGTTGVPKGVLLTNENLSLLPESVSAQWSMDDSSATLVAMPMFHIGGIGWLLVSLAGGAANVLVPQIVPGELLDTMERERITNAFLVPTVLQMLCAIPGAAERDWSALRSIAYGASPITTTVLKAALSTFRCSLFQLYGMTETAGAIVQLDPDDHDPGGPREHLLRAAGRAYPWMELQVVDPARGTPRAPGEVGEVRVRGSAVTPGYFGRPTETAAAFDEEGWLRTGDGGYLDEEGFLFLTDRIKDMIVSGAENVYPIEVEEVLAAHPDVGEVAVIGTPDERWGERVTAIVVPRPGAPSDGDSLVAFARERLAGFKLPRTVHFATELPKTASGKVLKRSLRETYADAPVSPS
ncbi:MAG TPA: long-chain-fatty-acid--CoA ligase [Solirubrobacteraceae bacterium]|jgi:long-chain acyl-CoA synthetase|nr:long-chain-fatty-acid--CoA ligase [Solirubrobacteraceae bacterium]